jgi:5-bromo-4-chloroindolyl phosphate hydrolysis protein
MPEDKVENQKIENRLTTLEVLMKDTRDDIGEIKKQVFNEIPHQIDSIKDRIFWGFLIGIAGMIIAQILLRFLK